MKKDKLFFILVLFVLMIYACRTISPTLPAPPNYADTISWFQPGEMTFDKKTDVFYVAPTCIWDWENDKGDTLHHMDIQNKQQRRMLTPAILLGKRVFADSCNFFSPYYRQITMESWMNGEEITNRRYPTALQDIEHAFDYYLKHYNQGRPFILAGHSQGAKSIIELLKHKLNATTSQQLVAAYPIGFYITKEELEHYPYLRPAKDSTDTGVTICFNSVTDTNAIAPLFKSNKVCINPLNWKTDTTHANRSLNRGTVFLDRKGNIKSDSACLTGARIDPVYHVLIVPDINPDPYFIPSIARIFPKGNFHVQELNLYFKNLRKNVIDRIHAYQKKHHQ